MNILFIGGTGNISAACVRRCVEAGHGVTVLNRGNRDLKEMGLEGVESAVADISDPQAVENVLGGRFFDVVADFIAFTTKQV